MAAKLTASLRQTELRALLLPLFVHSYMILVDAGYGDAAAALFAAFNHAFQPTHTALLSQIRSLALPRHLTSDPLAVRFRSERYIIKLTQTTFMLLLGWLTDGLGPVSNAGAGADSGLDAGENPERRGRQTMLKILNERCRIQSELVVRALLKFCADVLFFPVLQASPYDLDPSILEEGVGLTGVGPRYGPARTSLRSQQYPQLRADAVSEKDAVAEFNASAAGPQLKLHPSMRMNERLQADVEKELELNEWSEKQREKEKARAANPATEGRGEADKSGDVSMADTSAVQADAKDASAKDKPEGLPNIAPASSAGLVHPVESDLLPGPSTYRNVDVNREVAKITDARKALRFDLALESGISSASFLSGVRDPTFNALGEEGARIARAAAMPSVCAYTFHDADDG